jgi:hypothetical protein
VCGTTIGESAAFMGIGMRERCAANQGKAMYNGSA